MEKLTLLAVFAHPDDEAFSTGGTLTRYAAEGCDVYLVSATRGEAGQILKPQVATKANLPDVREHELGCACQTYGIHPPLFLDYLDGQLTIANQGQAVGKLVRIIRRLRPQVMVTFGPEGIYGHYDHVAIHRWATIAYRLSGDRSCFPEMHADSCSPHQVSKLYHRVLSDEEVAAIAGEAGEASVDMDGVPFPFVGYPRQQITTVIDVSPFWDIKIKGITCHQTQIGEQDPTEFLGGGLPKAENFILARSTLPAPTGIETDLFAGLR